MITDFLDALLLKNWVEDDKFYIKVKLSSHINFH
jgi:hypothetical protein